MNTFIEELTWRGLIHQKTPGIEKAFEQGTTLYLGIDPTGDTLHVGHFLGILFLKRALQYGNKIIVLAGGGTSKIGDPGGKDTERPILPKEIIEANKEKLKKQFSKFFEFDDEHVIMVDNSDWLEQITLIDFLRDAGKFMPVNSMLDKDSVKSRITREEGISYAEFSYQLLQAYDFMELFQKYHCEVQIGGSDQWGNIVQGVELIRKKLQKQAYALSFPLIVNPKTGKKFGKTEQGAAIWLDREKTHPFAFYQFFINIEDDLAPVLMKYFSFKSQNEIETLIKEWEAQKETRLLQKALAHEITTLIHGKETADQAQKIASILFYKGTEEWTKDNLDFIKKAIPYATISSAAQFSPEQAVMDLGLVSSKGEARRLVQQNGVHVEPLFDTYYLVRKGKREYGIIEIV